MNDNVRTLTVVKPPEPPPKTPQATSYPWDRAKGERSARFEMFQTYLLLGPDRSVAKAAAAMGKSYHTLEDASKTYKWRERAEAWDSHVAAKAQEKAMKDLLQARERSAVIGHNMLVRVAQKLQTMDPDEIPPSAITKLSAEALSLIERALGVGDSQPTEETERRRIIIELPSDPEARASGMKLMAELLHTKKPTT
jgi:hypothetical protein